MRIIVMTVDEDVDTYLLTDSRSRRGVVYSNRFDGVAGFAKALGVEPPGECARCADKQNMVTALNKRVRELEALLHGAEAKVDDREATVERQKGRIRDLDAEAARLRPCADVVTALCGELTSWEMAIWLRCAANGRYVFPWEGNAGRDLKAAADALDALPEAAEPATPTCDCPSCDVLRADFDKQWDARITADRERDRYKAVVDALCGGLPPRVIAHWLALVPAPEGSAGRARLDAAAGALVAFHEATETATCPKCGAPIDEWGKTVLCACGQALPIKGAPGA